MIEVKHDKLNLTIRLDQNAIEPIVVRGSHSDWWQRYINTWVQRYETVLTGYFPTDEGRWLAALQQFLPVTVMNSKLPYPTDLPEEVKY